MDSESTGKMRLAKLLAARGVASRRKAEELIFSGSVSVDGRLAEHPAEMVDPFHSAVKVDGRLIADAPEKVYFLLYKPKGYITGRNDERGRKTVFDLVEDMGIRVEPVGRLDYDTEGALLLTNDGHLAHALTHPSRHVPKRYMAKVYRTPSAATIKAIEEGRVFLDDGAIKPAKVRVVDTTGTSNAWVEITVTEGRNRLIRRLFQQMGHPVSKLRRESFATLSLRGLERGMIRSLTPDEVSRLQEIGRGVQAKKAGRNRRMKGHALPRSAKKSGRKGDKKRSRP